MGKNLRPRDTLANRLRLMRHDLGLREKGTTLSLREVAERCEVTPQTWQLWEAGSMPRHAQLVLTHVADTLGYDAGWLIGGGDLEAVET